MYTIEYLITIHENLQISHLEDQIKMSHFIHMLSIQIDTKIELFNIELLFFACCTVIS